MTIDVTRPDQGRPAYVSRERLKKIMGLAVKEAVLPTVSHLLAMDGLGVFSAMAKRIAFETAETAEYIELSREEHDSFIARILVNELHTKMEFTG